ncbi:unnamed protein product [Durusdinium trenchii]|uniref:Peptidase_C25 domain-containing protein n=2 Tax=Durusdinium trenchii TaxID=1381693 RepID=A0ABP0HYU0_9DINO
MLGSYTDPESGDEVLISADSRGFQWINATADERLSFEFHPEDFKLIPAEGSGHEIEITFETDDDGFVSAALRGEKRYERLVGSMEMKVREGPVHLSLPEVTRKSGTNIHAFMCNLLEDPSDWRDFSVLLLIATNAHLNSGIPCVIVDDTSPADDDAIQNLLDRLQPNQVTVFRSEDEEAQGQIEGNETAIVTERTCNGLAAVNDFVAATWAKEIQKAVVVSNGDYALALLATSLACLLDAPLFVTEGPVAEADLGKLMPDLGSYPVIVLGEQIELDADVTSLADVAAVTGYVKDSGISIKYLAVTNPSDRATRKLSLTAPIYAAVHGGLVLPLKDVAIQKPAPLDGEPLMKVKEQLEKAYQVLGQPRWLALVGSPQAVPACKTTEDVNNSKEYAVTDYPYATAKFNLDDAHEIAVGRCFTDSSTAAFLLATRSANFVALKSDGDWRSKIVDAGLWGFPEIRQLFFNSGFTLASCQKGDMQPLHQKDFEEDNKTIEAAAVLHKDHSWWGGLGQCVGRNTNAMLAPCVMVSLGCHAAGIDEGVPSCASRLLARGAVCFTGAARCPTAIATLWSVAFFNELLCSGSSVGEANREAHNKFMAHHLKGINLGKYTLVNRFTLGDPALRPFPNVSMDITPARHSFGPGGSVTVFGPSSWKMVEVHQDQLKEWKYDGKLFDPVALGCAPEAGWCGGGYDKQEAFYQLAIKVPAKTKGAVLTSLVLDNDGEEVKAEDKSSDVDPVCGQYECSQYVDNGNANDWHYVTVTKDENGYRWTNKAGVSWGLDEKTLDICEDCPYHSQGRHNNPKRNAFGIVTSMNFGGEHYNRADYHGCPELGAAKKKVWSGEPQGLQELSDGKKLLLVPVKMMECSQQEGTIQSFLKSITLRVLVDDDEEVDLQVLNQDLAPAQRGGGRGAAMARQNRGDNEAEE